MNVYTVYSKHHDKVMYVGQTINTVEHRRKKHIRESKRVDYAFYRAIRKYGIENFVFTHIASATNKDNLNDLEIQLIEQYDTYRNGYNETLGGDTMSGYEHKDETKKKIGKKLKERWKNNREEIMESLMKRPPRPQLQEERDKRREHMLENNPMKGKNHTEEARKKMSAKQSGAGNARAQEWVLTKGDERVIVKALKTYCADLGVKYLHVYNCWAKGKEISQGALAGWRVEKAK